MRGDGRAVALLACQIASMIGKINGKALTLVASASPKNNPQTITHRFEARSAKASDEYKVQRTMKVSKVSTA